MKKILFDFFPLILFFIGLKLGDIYTATWVAIFASIGQIVWLKVKKAKIETSNWLNLIIIVLFGGATIYLQDDTFIKWKPTVLYWIFALIILGALFIFKKNVLKSLMGSQIELPEPAWNKMAYSWSIFFITMGLLNLWVAFSGIFTLDQWATFKVFGMTLLMFIFIIGQSFFLSKYLQDEDQK